MPRETRRKCPNCRPGMRAHLRGEDYVNAVAGLKGISMGEVAEWLRAHEEEEEK